MKKLTMMAVALAALGAFAELKVGTVDMMKLVRNHPSYETNKALLTSTEKDYQKRIDYLKGELDAIQEEGKKLADDYRNPMLAQAAKTKIENELTEVQRRFIEQQQKLRAEALKNQQDLSELEGRLLKTQADDLKKRIAVFAEKNGYDFVFDSTVAVFGKAEYDVTDQVLKEMGVDPQKASEKEED